VATDAYLERGVASRKLEVAAAVSKLDPGLYPGAFCKILADLLGGRADHCGIMHNDGPGTKILVAYILWRKTLNLDFWRGPVRDGMVMNIDDLICVGALGPYFISLSINRNKHLISGDVIDVIIDETNAFCKFMTSLGIECHYAAGDTADVGDNTRTINIDYTFSTAMKRSEVIDASRITNPGWIVGFYSAGRAKWETETNSGVGANGLTSARHDLLNKTYKTAYKETYAPETRADLIYRGKYLLEDPLRMDRSWTVGQALSSPTRTYAPLVKEILRVIPREKIYAFIHCSGGGQTKIGNFGRKGLKYFKNDLFPPPAIFRELRLAGNLSLERACQTYNMGHRLEMVAADMETAEDSIKISKSMGIDAKIVGPVLQNTNPSVTNVYIQSGDEWASYDF